MGSLSHDIERYLKAMLAQQDEGVLVVQRSVLSEKFCCVPSQINYVLRTRFTPSNGYIVETRRGGGGYVRIQSVHIDTAQDFRPLMEASKQSLTEKEGEGILNYLVEEDILPPDMATVLSAILKNRVLQFPEPMTTNELRAYFMQHLLAHMSLGKTQASKQEAEAPEETKQKEQQKTVDAQ